MSKSFIIETRSRIRVNTDPQRRCYNGAFFSSELIWGHWDWLERGFKTEDEALERVQFWKELNAYAVSERGKGARREFRVREV